MQYRESLDKGARMVRIIPVKESGVNRFLCERGFEGVLT